MNNFDPFNVRRKQHSVFASPVKQKAPRPPAESSLSSAFHELDDISEPLIDHPRKSHEATSSTAAGGMSSYAIPRGATPLSTDHPREQAEWQQQHRRGQSGHKITATEKINSMFAAKGELPMYKDKPFNYSGSKRVPFYRQWRILLSIPAALVLLLYITGYLPGFSSAGRSRARSSGASWRSGAKTPFVDWNKRQEQVKEAFRLNWNAYETHAWGECLCCGSRVIF